MRILLVEDNDLQRDALRAGLAASGYAIETAADGERGLAAATAGTFDLIVLDVMLPRVSGFEILRHLRDGGSMVPVLLLTARDGVEDRVAGLDLGADDYLVKPFAFAEFLARARALIRRGHRAASSRLMVGDIEIDAGGRTVRRAGVEIPLTPREFAVLEYLCLRAGSVVTRQELCEHLYELDSDPDSNALDVFISRLRRKMSLPGRPAPIQTRRGHGYILATAAAA